MRSGPLHVAPQIAKVPLCRGLVLLESVLGSRLVASKYENRRVLLGREAHLEWSMLGRHAIARYPSDLRRFWNRGVAWSEWVRCNLLARIAVANPQQIRSYRGSFGRGFSRLTLAKAQAVRLPNIARV